MKSKIGILTIILFLVALTTRFIALGQVPSSLDWDEASLGYNAYSILKTGRDEFGNFLPVNLRSFEDYKPALYSYLSIIPIAIFGLNEFSTRFVSAFFGTLTVLIVFWLSQELFKKDKQGLVLSFYSAFWLAISPWHLQFSRAAFEANLGLFWFSTGAWLFLRFLRKRDWSLAGSALAFVLAMYSYHSFRLVAPIFGLLIFIKHFKKLWEEKKILLISFILVVILGLPLVFSFLKQGGQARFSSVTTLSPQGTLDRSIEFLEQDLKANNPLFFLHNRRVVYFLTALKGYLDHFSPNFLFLVGDHTLRHHLLNHGVLYLFQLPLIIVGMIFLLKKKKSAGFFIFLWLMVAPLASALTSGTPHAVRAILMVIPLTIFSAIGFWRMSLMFKTKRLLPITVYLLLITFIARYFIQYHFIYPKQSAQDWQYGFREVVEFLEQENQGQLKTIVTYKYDQPHVFFMFYLKTDPKEYQEKWASNPIERFSRSFANFEFRMIDWEKDQKLRDVYLVATPEEVPEELSGLVKEIYFPNGEIAFRIMKL